MTRERPILFAENDDSFSWNVVECLPFPRERVVIVPGGDLAGDPGRLREAAALVVGPGPTDPGRAGLSGLLREALDAGLPTLGVCLGHQAIGLALGARLVRCEPAHGVVSSVVFRPSRLFPGIAGPEPCMRYHSLVLADVPPPLRVVATLDGGLPMAIEHVVLPVAGLQFHPDSHGTPRGRAMLRSFFRAVGVVA